MPSSLHTFQIGDQAEISYCYRTYTSTYTSTVVQTGRAWIAVATKQENQTPVRYFLKTDQWRSEFGHRVAITKANHKQQEPACVVWPASLRSYAKLAPAIRMASAAVTYPAAAALCAAKPTAAINGSVKPRSVPKKAIAS